MSNPWTPPPGRSLAACEQLSRAGYTKLAWINGGFDMCKKKELPTVDGKDIRYGGIGGLSEVLGWTEVRRRPCCSAVFVDSCVLMFVASRLFSLNLAVLG